MSKPPAAVVRFALLFAAIGPAVSATPALFGMAWLVGRLDGSAPGFELETVLDALPRVLLGAYAVGAIPAALGGALVGAASTILRSAWPTYAAAAAVGVLAPALALAVLHAPPGQWAVFAPGGVIAALLAAGLARRMEGTP